MTDTASAAPSDLDIDATWDALPGIRIHNDANARGLDTQTMLRRAFARAVLAKWGQPTHSEPVVCGCGDEYPPQGWDAGFIAAIGRCANCQAALDCAQPTPLAAAAPGEREQFERYVKAYTGRDIEYHQRHGTTGLEFGWTCWQAARAQPTPPAADQEPFGYFRAEPFGWTDCAEADEGAVALYERPTPPAVVEPLTDEQIKDEASHYGFVGNTDQLVNFVRGIEAAHGIGIKGGQHGTE